MKFIKYIINEGVKNTHKITIDLRDPDNQMSLFLEKIKKHAGPGHSFSVIVDPDESKENGGSESYYFDGDGSFYIDKLNVEEL